MNSLRKNINKPITFTIILILILIIFIPPFKSYRKQQEEIKNLAILNQELLKEVEARKLYREKQYLTGHFNPVEHKDFALIPLKYIYAGNNMYLRKEALESFIKMQDMAKKDGINLKISSATRNFDYQNSIWNKKWTNQGLMNNTPSDIEKFKKILEYSAAPGTSRHHWGTDIDINGADPAYFETYKGNLEYKWLVANASEFGFCQPYNKKGENRLNGYHEEKWHWSYTPIAKDFTQKYVELIALEDMSGFAGDEYVEELDLMNNYILSINPECL